MGSLRKTEAPVLCSKGEKEVSRLSQMEKIEVFKFSVFVGFRYLECAGAGWERYNAILDQECIITEGTEPTDPVAFVHAASLFLEKKSVKILGK